MNFKISLPISTKMLARIWMGISLTLQVNLKIIDVLTIMSLPIYLNNIGFGKGKMISPGAFI